MHEEASTRNASAVSRPMIALLGLLLVLLFSSVGTNFVLAARLREAGELIAKQSPQSLKLGTSVAIIKARDLQKGPQQVGFSKLSTPTLLYVFTPSCGWCTKNVANIKALADHTRDHYRLIGLSLSSRGLAEYIAQHGIAFPALTDPDPETVRSYHLGPTPATILISAAGTVQKIWLGAWDGRTHTEIETRFGLRLPGLQGLIRNSPVNIQPEND